MDPLIMNYKSTTKLVEATRVFYGKYYAPFVTYASGKT